MFDVISIGTALVDIFVRSPELRVHHRDDEEWLCELYGEKLSVSDLNLFSGGAGSNTAVGFQRLGFRSACVVELGHDTLAELVLSELKKEGVETKYVIQEKREQTGGSVILIGEDGGRTALVYRGAASLLDPKDIPLEELTQARWLHLSSLGGQLETLQHLFAIVNHYQLQVSWNPGKAELELLRSAQLPIDSVRVQVLLLNREEWELLEPLHEVLQTKVPQIVITDGAEGGQVLVPGQMPLTYSAQKTESVDDTGAGDSFATGYVSALLSGCEVSDAVKWGTANAAAVIQKVGAKAGLLTREAMREHLTQLS